MFRSVLVPLDGSVRAEQALGPAAQIARVTGGTLHLLQVVAYPEEYATPIAVPPVSESVIAEWQGQCADYLHQVAANEFLTGIAIETEIRIGLVAPCILEAVRDRGADLVVMSSHGRTGLARWMLGSVSQSVSRHSPAPVLIVRSDPAGSSRAEGQRPGGSPIELGPSDAILVPLDGSPLAEEALEPAACLAKVLASASGGPALHLVLVVKTGYGLGDTEPHVLTVDRALGYLEGITGHLTQTHDGLRATWWVGRSHDVAATLLTVAAHGEAASGRGGKPLAGVGTALASGCKLVVLATHGRSGIAHWAVGSVAERMLEASSSPLVIVRTSPAPAASFPKSTAD